MIFMDSVAQHSFSTTPLPPSLCQLVPKGVKKPRLRPHRYHSCFWWFFTAESTSSTVATRASPQCKGIGPASGGVPTSSKERRRVAPDFVERLREDMAEFRVVRLNSLVLRMLLREECASWGARKTGSVISATTRRWKKGNAGEEESNEKRLPVWRSKQGSRWVSSPAPTRRWAATTLCDPASQSACTSSFSSLEETATLLPLSRRPCRKMSLSLTSQRKPSTVAMHKESTKSNENGINKIDIPAVLAQYTTSAVAENDINLRPS